MQYRALRIYDPDKKTHLRFDRNDYLKAVIKGGAVLHVGCSDFPITEERINEKNLLHGFLQETAREMIGIDLSEEGVAIMKRHGYDDVQVMDAEDMKFSRTFDFIVAGDVLEHISNPGLFLRSVGGLLSRNGELIVGVPSAFTFNNLKPWFLGREQVHADHVFYFSPKTLAGLCGRFGLLPVKLVFTVQPRRAGQSKAFILVRESIIRVLRAAAPSFVMHFKNAEDVDKHTYVDWG